MSTIWPCKKSQNKHNLCHRKDCMEKFCEFLREHVKYKIDFEKKIR